MPLHLSEPVREFPAPRPRRSQEVVRRKSIRISAEGRAKIAEAQRRRWAAAKTRNERRRRVDNESCISARQVRSADRGHPATDVLCSAPRTSCRSEQPTGRQTPARNLLFRCSSQSEALDHNNNTKDTSSLGVLIGIVNYNQSGRVINPTTATGT
jgi:hypothetical protein